MSEMAPDGDALTMVARDLTAIEEMAPHLEEQAIHKANDRDMPGGDAMVALAGVANLEAWQHRVDTELRTAYDYGHAPPEIDDDDEWEPPLQTLCFWSEAWRAEHGAEYGQRPTIASEANYIRYLLPWAWDNEPHWDDFADDVRKAKRRMEDVLYDGKRHQRGVQCFDCQVDLVRPSRDRRDPKFCPGHDGVCMWPHKFCPHDRGGLADEWFCPTCERRYDTEAYKRAVSHAHFVHADWLTIADAAERTGVKATTIKVWATRGKVRKRRDLDSGRMSYNVTDVLRHGEATTEDEAS